MAGRSPRRGSESESESEREEGVDGCSTLASSGSAFVRLHDERPVDRALDRGREDPVLTGRLIRAFHSGTLACVWFWKFNNRDCLGGWNWIMSVAAGAFSGGLALGLVVFLIIIIVGWRRRRKEPSDDGQSDLRVARGLGDTRSERLKNATYVSAAFLVVAS